MLLQELKKNYKDEKEVLERDFRQDVEIDKDLSLRFRHRFRGSVRVTEGLFFERNEYEKWKEEVLKSKLP